MKQILLLIAFLIPISGMAQIELERTSDNQFRVTFDGDVIVHPDRIEIVGEQKERPIFEDFGWDMESHHGDLSSYIFTYASTTADSIHTVYTCGDHTSRDLFGAKGTVYFSSANLSCTEDLTIDVHVFAEGDTIHHQETIPQFLFGDIPESSESPIPESSFPEWSAAWGSLEVEETDELILTLTDRNIARIEFNDSQHQDIEVTVTETIDPSHSTGIHLGLRSSKEPQQHAIETYINEQGFGVSVFHNGQWSNPHTWDFGWEYGEPISYSVRIEDSTLSVDWGEGWKSYSNEIFSQITEGSVMIGSTGAGTYIINDFEINNLN